MKLELVIPTINRLKKLSNCLDSIIKAKKDNDIVLTLYFTDLKELDIISDKYNLDWISFSVIEEYRVPTFWNKCLNLLKSDALCYLNDDIELYEDTISNICDIYPQYFPDFDGILGIHQTNLPESQVVKTAFGIIGKKYISRFPENQVYCPDYYRFFGDYEMYLYAKEIDKFKYNKKIKLKHFHPAFDLRMVDDTHKNVRKWLPIDKIIFRERQELGWLWGKDFNLLRKKIERGFLNG